MGAYCTDDDVFTLGLAAQAFVVRARPVQAADIDGATGTIRLKAHGLTSADLVTLEVTSGGSLPTGLSAFTAYSPIVVSFDLLQLAETPDGDALTFASGGSGWGLAIDPLRRLRAHALEVSAEIDEHLTAHDVPIQPDPVTGKYPQVLVGLAARMAARAGVNSLQIENPQYKVAVDRLFAREEFDKILLADWKAGKPVQPRPTDGDDVADNGARASSARRPVCWETGRL